MFILKEVQGGWFAYRCHVLGSTFIFIALYSHIFRGFYYQLYSWETRFNWLSGYILYALFMLTAFLGYILPWGQMSFWAATVIINMTSIIPFFGEWLTTILWGGYSVNNCTLQRFFVLHFLMPFVILALAFLHISVIHSINSTSNFNVRNSKQSRVVKLPDISLIDLYPLLIIKDIVMVTFTILVSFLFLVYNPEYFTNFVNWEKANPQLTPAHIVPEWYFLPFYGLVKLIPHKVLGICSMVLLILFPLTLPFINIYK